MALKFTGIVQPPKLSPINEQKTTPASQPSPIQRLLKNPEPEPQDKWYKGEQPTASEIGARIYTISQTDPNKGRELFNQFQQFQADPSSPYFNPYTQSTNKAIQELSNLGFDMSGGITQEWLAQNSWLKNYYRMENGNTPLDPSSKSTKEQDAAYWYYKALSAEETTQKAENEWAALQEEIKYWTGRTDRNYSDDDILAKINWKNYPTLAGMDEARGKGLPTVLNRGIGYSQDSLRGVIWAARNGDESGDYWMDSVKAELGQGNRWKDNSETRAKLEIGNEAYSPYSVGSTDALDDAALYFGVSSFGPNWLADNIGILNGNDATAKKYYDQVVKAEMNTVKAEAELKNLHAEIDEWLKYTSDPDMILDGLLDGYTTLKKMDDSMKTGDLLATTRAVDFRMKDIEDEVRKRCEQKNAAPGGNQYARQMGDALGLPMPSSESDDAVLDAKNDSIKAAAPTIKDAGTDEEKLVFQTAYEYDFDGYAAKLSAAIENGTLDPQAARAYVLESADQYAKANYFSAQKAMRPYLKTQAQIETLETEQKKLKRQRELEMRLMDWEDQSPYKAPWSPYTSLQVGENYYEVAADFDPETGRFNVGKPDRIEDIVKQERDDRVWNGVSDVVMQYDPTGEGAENTNTVFDDKIYPVILDYAARQGISEDDVAPLVDAFYDDWIGHFYDADGKPLGDLLSNLKGSIDSMAGEIAWDDEAAQVAADEWAATLPDFSAYAEPGKKIERMGGEEFEQLTEDLREVNSQIGELHEQLKGQQAAYDKGQEQIARIEKSYKLADDIAQLNGIAQRSDSNVMPVMKFLYAAGGEWQPTDYQNVYSLYDAAMMNGYDYDAVAQAAVDGKAEYEEGLKNLQFAVDQAKEMGIPIDADVQENLDRQAAWYQQQIEMADWFLVRQNPDFEETVRNVYNGIVLSQQSGFSVGPYSYEDLNITNTNGGFLGSLISTPEENETYLYILGTQGREAADRYKQYVQEYINSGYREKIIEAASDAVKSGAIGSIGANALSAIVAPLELIPTLGVLGSAVFGAELSPNDPIFTVTNFRNAVRNTSKEEINKATKDKPVANFLANMGYDLVTNVADNAANMAAFGGIGSGISNEFLQGAVTALPMAVGTGGATYQNAKFAGASEDQALAMAGASMFSEWITETIEVNTILDAFSKGGEKAAVQSLKQLVGGALKSMGNEGVGEAASELVENGLDYLIKNNMNGLDPEEWDWAEIGGDAAYAALLGALSGGMFQVSGDIFTGRTRQAIELQFLAQQQGVSATKMANDINAGITSLREAMELQARTEALNKRQSDHQARVRAAQLAEGFERGQASQNAGQENIDRARVAGQPIMPGIEGAVEWRQQLAEEARQQQQEELQANQRGGPRKETQETGAGTETGAKNQRRDAGALMEAEGQNGEKTKIRRVELDEDTRQPVAMLENGETVAVADMDLTDRDDILLNAAADMDQEAGQILVQNAAGTEAVGEYARGMKQAYSAGYAGKALENVNSAQIRALDQSLAQQMWDAGRRAGAREELSLGDEQNRLAETGARHQQRDAGTIQETLDRDGRGTTARDDAMTEDGTVADTTMPETRRTSTAQALAQQQALDGIAPEQTQEPTMEEGGQGQNRPSMAQTLEQQQALDGVAPEQSQEPAQGNEASPQRRASMAHVLGQQQALDGTAPEQAPETMPLAGNQQRTPSTAEALGMQQPFGPGQGESADFVTKQVAALTASLDANEASQTATMAAVLSSGRSGTRIQRLASAAAQHAYAQFGEQAVDSLRGLLVDGARRGISNEEVRTAFMTAALGGGRAGTVLQAIAEHGAINRTQALIEAAAEDQQDEQVMASINETAQENAVAGRVRDLAGDKALEVSESSEAKALEKAEDDLRKAEESLQTSQKELEALTAQADMLSSQQQETAGDSDYVGRIGRVLNEIKAKFQNVVDLRAAVEAAENAMKTAQDALGKAHTDALTAARQQAQQDVAQQLEAERKIEDQIAANQDNGFAQAYNNWDGITRGIEFTIGTPGDALIALGVPDIDITLTSDKILRIKKKHKGMSDAVIKQIPSIVQDPILVMKSKTVEGRLAIFGELMDENGYPVLAAITTTPSKNNNASADVLVMNSAYGKDTQLQAFIDSSEILYTDERAAQWASSLRLYLPSTRPTSSSSNARVAQNERTVNRENNGIVYLPDNTSVNFHYELADVDTLITSNDDDFERNPNFPEELQPRDRSREANREQVDGIARNLNPARLAESADVQTGAPIVGSDYVVESGNGRTMAVRRAMNNGYESAANYTNWLRENAARFGLNPADVTDRSVLVRVREGETNRASFAQASNESATAAYSTSENAVSDAQKITDAMMEQFAPSDDGRLDVASNHGFALSFINNVIPASERNQYLQSNGQISQQGWSRIRNAVLQKAYGSNRIVQLVSESTGAEGKNVLNALVQAAPRMMAMVQDAQNGTVFDIGLADAIAKGAERYVELKNAGEDVTNYLQHGAGLADVFSDSEATRQVLWMLEENKRSAKKIANALQSIMDQLYDAGDPRMGSLLGELQTPDVASVIREGSDKAAGRGLNGQMSFYRGNNGGQGIGANQQTTPKRSPQRIAKDLANALHFGDFIGTRKMNNLPAAVLGYYQHQARYASVRNTSAGNYAVTMHELGHGLSDLLNMTGTQDMINNLDPVFAASYTAQELPGEAFAEFVWRYMADDATARAFAGDAFTDSFERALQERGIARQVHDAAAQLRAWVNATTNEQIATTIHARSERASLGLSEMIRRAIDRLVDSSNAAEAVNHRIRQETGNRNIPLDMDVRANALMKNTASRRAYAILTQNLTDANWTRTGDGLAVVLERAGLTANNVGLFERWMLAQHSLDRDARGLPVFDDHITPAARTAFIQDTLAQHPEFSEIERAFQQWRKDFMKAFMVDTGYLSQAAFDRMNAMYPHYVPTQRVKDERVRGRGSKIGDKKYTVRRATGSTEDIWSPLDTFYGMVDSIVNMVSANNAALAWDRAFHQVDGLGEFGREITPDMRNVTVNTESLQRQVADRLENNAADDVIQDVLDMIGTEQSQWINQHGSSLPNVLTVQHADGTRAYYEIADTELYKLLAGVNETVGKNGFELIAKLTRGMSALTTGSNPVFAIRNFMRDFQNSVNYGSWASNYATGAAKWLRASWDIWRNNGQYQDYVALGGGGWTRIDSRTRKGAEELQQAMYRGYNTQNLGHTLKWAGQKIWNTITLARLNEVVEQTSRYAEYKYGAHDLTTAQGRAAAYLAAQEATVDFTRSGNSALAKSLKQLIPFFNASTQGIYRTGRMLTEAERGRAPERFSKTIINTALMSALCVGILKKFMDDDDQEEFAMMSDDLKAQHFYLPNFAPEVFGQQPLIRIPIGQDPLMYAVHSAVTNALWGGTDDGLVIDLGATANTILDNLNPVGSGTVFQPIIGVMMNQNWYGSRIVPTRMDKWEPTTQFTEETPDAFIMAGRGLGMSPMKVQYLAEQYTGFLGQMLIPAFSKDEHTGELGGLRAAITAAQKRLTSDPLVSNDVMNSFYDGAAVLEQVKSAAENDRPMNMLRRGLTEEEAGQAYEMAKGMLSSKGIIGETKKAINAAFADIDTINANETLTQEQKYELTSQRRKEMLGVIMEAQEQIGAFIEAYVTGRNMVTDLIEGTYASAPTAYDKLDQTFKGDEQQLYMQRAKAVYDATGEDNALPHPNTSFTSNKQTYEISQADWANYTTQYKIAYQKYLAENGGKWDILSSEEQLDMLRSAHTAGHNASVKWYKKIHGIK